MTFKAVIKSDHNSEALSKIFSQEDREFDNNRAAYDITNENPLQLDIRARDATAFRAVLSTITKIIAVNDKVTEVVENERRRDPGEGG